MTMFKRHVSRRLAAYIDGELAPVEARRAETHLRECPRCDAEREEVKWAMTMVGHLPAVEAPETIWASIEAALEVNQPIKRQASGRWRWALATAVVVAMAGAGYWRFAHPSGARWEVIRVAGSPSVSAKTIGQVGRIGAGEWIETDSNSRAIVKVGEIGSVEIAPNTRLRVVTARAGEHRLALARGEIRAKISAPPKLFFVDTASGTAVDLGCEYALSTDENGSGVLHVTKGWVSFEWKGLESLVPAGASCRTRPGTGPGVPYFDDASDALKQALEILGVEKTADDPIDTILSESRVRDTLTLWHLLSRVDPADRGRVFDRIAALTPVPPGVTREQALRLDSPTLQIWKDDLAWKW